MVLENLGRSLHSALKKITRSAHIDEEAIKSLAKDIQQALLQADVNVQLVMDLTKRIEKRALKEKVPSGVPRKEHMVRIVYEELSDFLGESAEISLEEEKPKVMLLVGLQGSGKTTSTAKLASYFQKRGYMVGMVCADTYRPGAYEQLKQLGDQIGVPVFGDPDGGDAVRLSAKGVEVLKEEDPD
ncbi:signal recognition particle, partial [candidate division MSBL1 archaeon SCGC-AAA261C02]